MKIHVKHMQFFNIYLPVTQASTWTAASVFKTCVGRASTWSTAPAFRIFVFALTVPKLLDAQLKIARLCYLDFLRTDCWSLILRDKVAVTF